MEYPRGERLTSQGCCPPSFCRCGAAGMARLDLSPSMFTDTEPSSPATPRSRSTPPTAARGTVPHTRRPSLPHPVRQLQQHQALPLILCHSGAPREWGGGVPRALDGSPDDAEQHLHHCLHPAPLPPTAGAPPRPPTLLSQCRGPTGAAPRGAGTLWRAGKSGGAPGEGAGRQREEEATAGTPGGTRGGGRHRPRDGSGGCRLPPALRKGSECRSDGSWALLQVGRQGVCPSRPHHPRAWPHLALSL